MRALVSLSLLVVMLGGTPAALADEPPWQPQRVNGAHFDDLSPLNPVIGPQFITG